MEHSNSDSETAIIVGRCTPMVGDRPGRKCLKPIIEKRRRERINRHLNQLKALVCVDKDKLEKADILELAVAHLRKLIAGTAAPSRSPDADSDMADVSAAADSAAGSRRPGAAGATTSAFFRLPDSKNRLPEAGCEEPLRLPVALRLSSRPILPATAAATPQALAVACQSVGFYAGSSSCDRAVVYCDSEQPRTSGRRRLLPAASSPIEASRRISLPTAAQLTVVAHVPGVKTAAASAVARLAMDSDARCARREAGAPQPVAYWRPW